MGKIFKVKKMTTLLEGIVLVIGLTAVLGGVYMVAPGLRVGDSQELDEMVLNDDQLNNVTNTAMLPLPSTSTSTSIQSQPRVRIAGYAWNGQTGIMTANGGPFTTKGSLMEQNGVNLELVRQDWLSGLRDMQFKFVEQYDGGEEYPSSDKSAFAIMIMGDGVPFYISTMNKALAEKFGEGKYHVENIGAIGMSNGEDKLIGPKEWKTNPKSMLGSLITVVLGDGDWVTTLNYCAANNLKVNPNTNNYDPNAVNFYASADDDYINSAKELIASQTEGLTIPLNEVIDGKLTGKTVNKTIDGCATWTPGDKMVFDVLGSKGFTDIASTADFPNQMATSVIVVKEWAETHVDIVTNVLKSTYTANNQIKQYDEWAVRGSECVAKTFNLETPQYWYSMFKGEVGKSGTNTYNMGGSRVLTYGDAMQYYGITDGINRYKSVYNQVSGYLTTLNPFGFNESVKGVTPYNDAVNLFYLKNINDVEVGTIDKADYTETKTTVMANGNWSINFNTGSADIKSSSNADLESIYNLLVQAEQTKITVVGHTDKTGSSKINQPLSYDRASSVVDYLVNKGISRSRIQSVEGKGDTEPVSSTATNAQNRRVAITFLQ